MKKYNKTELNQHTFSYLMDLLREEYPFKPNYWYESFESKDEIIYELLKANDND